MWCKFTFSWMLQTPQVIHGGRKAQQLTTTSEISVITVGKNCWMFRVVLEQQLKTQMVSGEFVLLGS